MNLIASIEPFTWQSYLFDILFTLIIYMLPLNFYRFIIHKKPIPQKKAAVLCYAYGFSIWLLLSTFYYIVGYEEVASIAAAGIWSTINYYILKKGYSNTTKKDSLSNKHGKHLTIEFVSITNDFISRINALFPKDYHFIVDCEAIVYVYINFLMHFDSVFDNKNHVHIDFDSFFQERIVDYATATKNSDILLGQSIYQITNNQQITELRKNPLLRSN